ncbi:MAG TPA: glycosyltransferase [Gaiellaceae bacterium]|nr:glycosyltransferase [Gaiellaceae bacterium]
MRILLVSQMYPGPRAPDFGVFVQDVARELERRGHELAYAVVDRRGGSPLKHGRLLARALAEARRFRPDVVYAHYLFPAGAAAAAAARVARAGLVVTAHGRDVRNVGVVRGLAAATRATLRGSRVVAVSDFLRRDLVARLPELRGRVEVIDCGVDLERFRGRDPGPLRERLGWSGEGPRFLCVGTLDRRKNVVRLADAFRRLEAGSLVFVGDGPLRAELEGRARVRVVGRVAHELVADWVAACDVLCQPSLVEPWGQALLEALASERPVVATRVGGPPEFVTSEVGALVDPVSVDAIADGLRAAAALRCPNPAARRIAEQHDVRRQAERIEAVLQAAAAE